MYFGRNEECGLGRVYHGWTFDVDGNCADMPNEPPETDFKHKVRMKAYPSAVWGGYIWIYTGLADKKPPLPKFERATSPPEHRWQKK